MKKLNEPCSTAGLTNPAERSPWGETRDRILKSIAKLDAATAAAVSSDTGIPRKSVTSILCRLSDPGPKQKVRVVDYECDHDSERYYPRPVYSIGQGAPITKPKPVPLQVLKNSYWKNRKMRTQTSVFDLAIPINKREKGRRAAIGERHGDDVLSSSGPPVTGGNSGREA